MAQILLKTLNRLTQCCTAEFLLNPKTARTVADTPVIKITPVAQTGISKIVSKDRSFVIDDNKMVKLKFPDLGKVNKIFRFNLI